MAFIWTNVDLFSLVLLKTSFSEILINILNISLEKTHLKMTTVKCHFAVASMCSSSNLIPNRI